MKNNMLWKIYDTLPNRLFDEVGVSGVDKKPEGDGRKNLNFNLITSPDSLEKIAEHISSILQENQFITGRKFYFERVIVGGMSEDEFYGVTVRKRGKDISPKLANYFINVEKRK